MDDEEENTEKKYANVTIKILLVHAASLTNWMALDSGNSQIG